MYFMTSLFFLVLFSRVLVYVKRPFVLAVVYALVIAAAHWVLTETARWAPPDHPLERTGIRLVLAWIVFAVLSRTESVWAWVLVVAVSPVICLV